MRQLHKFNIACSRSNEKFINISLLYISIHKTKFISHFIYYLFVNYLVYTQKPIYTNKTNHEHSISLINKIYGYIYIYTTH